MDLPSDMSVSKIVGSNVDETAVTVGELSGRFPRFRRAISPLLLQKECRNAIVWGLWGCVENPCPSNFVLADLLSVHGQSTSAFGIEG